MPSHRRFLTVCLVTSLTLGVFEGCSSLHKTEPKKEQTTGSILSTGSDPKVTNQQSADIQIALGRSFEQEGNAEEAKAAYLSALKKDSKRIDAVLRLAIIEDQKGNIKESDRLFAQALKIDPKNPDLLCDRGYSFYQRKQLPEAEALLKQALTLNPLHQRSHTNLALVLARRGDIPSAIQEFTKAGCDKSDAHANLGLALAMDGKFDESKKQYVQALAAKPSSPAATKGLQATIVALAEQGDARTLATRVTPVAPATPADPALMRTSSQTGNH